MDNTNSSLVNYVKISPNKHSPRNHAIDTITIHCVVGQASVETLGNVFNNPNRQVSANYGIGADGRIGMYVEEKDRSWCSSNSENDNRAITIECASDNYPPYAINDDVYESLINLCADICKRNGIPELKWQANPAFIGDIEQQNMTVHRWFSNKSCPGEYIFSRLGKIAAEVNEKLRPVEPKKDVIYYKVQAGAFSEEANAIKLADSLKRVGLGSFINFDVVDRLYKVQVGAFFDKNNAIDRVGTLKELGFDGYIYEESTTYPDILVPENTEPEKSIEELAKEVLAGKWGNGLDRKQRLTKAGYDYLAVQRKVNSML